MAYPSTTEVYLITKESVKGTKLAGTKSMGRLQSVSVSVDNEVISSDSMNSIETQAVNLGIKSVSHTVTVEYQNGRPFEFAVGTSTPVATSSDYKHTFAIDDVPASFSADSGEDLSTDTCLHIGGNIIESLELATALNKNVTVSFTAKGMNVTSDTTCPAKTEDSIAVLPHANTHISINGVEATEVQNASVTIEKKTVQSGGIGSTAIVSNHATGLKFKFKASLGFDAKTYQDMVVGDTFAGFIFNAHNGVTLGSGRVEVKLTLATCKLSKFEKTASIGELVFASLEGEGILSELFTVDTNATYP